MLCGARAWSLIVGSPFQLGIFYGYPELIQMCIIFNSSGDVIVVRAICQHKRGLCQTILAPAIPSGFHAVPRSEGTSGTLHSQYRLQRVQHLYRCSKVDIWLFVQVVLL